MTIYGILLFLLGAVVFVAITPSFSKDHSSYIWVNSKLKLGEFGRESEEELRFKAKKYRLGHTLCWLVFSLGVIIANVGVQMVLYQIFH